MARKTDPADVVMKFFSEAHPEAVRVVFPMVKGICERRGLLAKRKAAEKTTTKRRTDAAQELPIDGSREVASR